MNARLERLWPRFAEKIGIDPDLVPLHEDEAWMDFCAEEGERAPGNDDSDDPAFAARRKAILARYEERCRRLDEESVEVEAPVEMDSGLQGAGERRNDGGRSGIDRLGSLTYRLFGAHPVRWPRAGSILAWFVPAALLCFLVVALAFSREVSPPGPSGWIKLIVSLLHVVMIALLLLRITSRGIRDPRPAFVSRRSIAYRAWCQFGAGWIFLWSTWLALYACLAVYFSGLAGQGGVASGLLVLADLLNLSSGFAFFFLFLVLHLPSVPSRTRRDRHRRFQKALGCSLLACAGAAVFAVWMRMGGVVWPDLGALVVCVSMIFFCLAVARRDMDVPLTDLLPLVLYAIIQGSWAEIASPGSASAAGAPAVEVSSAVLLVLALALKLWVYFKVEGWMSGETLRNYFVRAAVRGTVEEEGGMGIGEERRRAPARARPRAGKSQEPQESYWRTR